MEAGCREPGRTIPSRVVLDDSRETIYRDREARELILVDTNILLRLRRGPRTRPSLRWIHLSTRFTPRVKCSAWSPKTSTNSGPPPLVRLPPIGSDCRSRVPSPVVRIKRLFRFLPDLPTLFAEWEGLVVTHACHGRASFDARLVAAMRTHGIARLLTLNRGRLTRSPGLSILDPTTIAAVAAPPPSTTP